MTTKVRRMAAVTALVASATVAGAACGPAVFRPPAGGGTSCPQGSWTLESQQLNRSLTTPFGSVTIAADPGGTVRLSLDGSGWTLAADQRIAASLVSPLGTVSGTIDVDAQASGTYTVSGDRITFTLAAVSGTVTYEANLFGRTVTGSVALANSGLQRLYGLSGTATYSCTNDLKLVFSSFTLQF